MSPSEEMAMKRFFCHDVLIPTLMRLSSLTRMIPTILWITSMSLWTALVIAFLRSHSSAKPSCRCRHIISATEEEHGASYPYPHIAWLMSFPNSGTTCTLHLTSDVSNFMCASNYATDNAHNEMHMTKDKSLSPWYILTETHCGGRFNGHVVREVAKCCTHPEL